MLANYWRIVAAVLFALAASMIVRAQEKDPEAYLRTSSSTERMLPNGTSSDDRFYHVEIYMPIRLKQDVHTLLRRRATGAKLGAIAAGNEELPYSLEVSPNDCTLDQADDCARTHFRIYLPKSTDTTKRYQVFFDSYPVDSGNNRRFRAIDVGLDYSSSIAKGNKVDLGGCADRIVLILKYAEEDREADQKKTPLRFQSEQDKQAYKKYAKQRLISTYNWVKGLNSQALSQTDLMIRPLSTLLGPAASRRATRDPSGAWILPDRSLWKLGELDLPRLRVLQLRTAQGTAEQSADDRFLSACFTTAETLPNEAFNIKVKFGQPDVPLELSKSFVKTAVEGNPLQAAPGKLEDSKVGQRLIERDLDVAVTFASSVEDKQKPNPAPNTTGTITVRERTTRATLDVRLAPLGIRSFFAKINSPLVGNTRTTGRTSAHYFLLTPFFIDAKVSTGEIVKDTLSLNRVILGTQTEYQYIHDTTTFPTYYRLLSRFSSASDRDFKQAEYKGTFEFRPVLSALNHPLVSIQDTQDQVIIDESNKNTPLTFISSQKGGYEIVPFFGGEIGRTYLRRNPAAAVKPSDTVRRLYAGADITLNPFNRTTLSASDTFYFNYGVPQKPRANYFVTSASFLLIKFAGSPQAGHSLFISYERGQQPPFDGPGVNALKVGYRIQADRIFSPLGTR